MEEEIWFLTPTDEYLSAEHHRNFKEYDSGVKTLKPGRKKLAKFYPRESQQNVSWLLFDFLHIYVEMTVIKTRWDVRKGRWAVGKGEKLQKTPGELSTVRCWDCDSNRSNYFTAITKVTNRIESDNDDNYSFVLRGIHLKQILLHDKYCTIMVNYYTHVELL